MIKELIDIELKIKDLPVFILSSPRTGSTILAKFISEKTKRKLYLEPSQKDKKKLHSFLIYSLRNKKYVLKEHALTFVKNYNPDFINQPSFKIRIRRKDLFSQVISNYIAINRKIFVFHKGQEIIDRIKFNDEHLLDTLKFVSHYNDHVNSLKYDFNLDLYYEDLDLKDDEIIPSPKPLNNEELMHWAKNILKSKVEI